MALETGGDFMRVVRPCECATLRADLARVTAERDEARVRARLNAEYPYAHMCRMDHEQIGHNDSSEERCPLCREQDRARHAESDLARVTAENAKLLSDLDHMTKDAGGDSCADYARRNVTLTADLARVREALEKIRVLGEDARQTAPPGSADRLAWLCEFRAALGPKETSGGRTSQSASLPEKEGVRSVPSGGADNGASTLGPRGPERK